MLELSTGAWTGHPYLEGPANRPLYEGELLQLLWGPAQRAGGAQGHPTGKHLLNESGPVGQ